MRLGMTLAIGGSSPNENLKLAEEVERARFDTISIGEAAYDTFAYASACAAVTGRTRIYSGVATWTRPPVLAATSAATVDRISHGRYTMGIGPMPRVWNEDWYGISYERPIGRMRSYVQVVRGALRAHSGAALDHEDEFFTVRNYTRMERPLRDELPIHLAATRPGMAELAGEIADGVLFNFLHSREWIDDVLNPAVSRGEERQGAPCERGVMVRCAVGDDPDHLRGQLARSFIPYLPVPYLGEMSQHHGWDLSRAKAAHEHGDVEASIQAIPDALLNATCIAGTPEQCRAQLQRYEGLVDWVLLTPPSGLPAEASAEAQRRILAAFARRGSTN